MKPPGRRRAAWHTGLMGVLALCVLAACRAAGAVPQQEGTDDVAVRLQDYGPAPELENEIWLNTEAPLRLADLRGQVVLLEMWTFDCINCRNVLPALRAWHADYGGQGLVIIGNHYPEFAHEADLDNLKAAVDRLDIEYPVAQDNEGVTWRAYDNHFWPALYLIDKQGHVRYKHIGEGRYEATEAAIKALLAEPAPQGN
jgi:thiol-disulfide isomerase/thioredoxin